MAAKEEGDFSQVCTEKGKDCDPKVPFDFTSLRADGNWHSMGSIDLQRLSSHGVPIHPSLCVPCSGSPVGQEELPKRREECS